jgi:hypothetical protein
LKPLCARVEEILFRRLMNKKLEGYTIQTAFEITALVLEEAAKVAEVACLVPPDGGAPHPMEVDVANAAAAAIRALV